MVNLVERVEWLPIRMKLGKNKEGKEPPLEESNTDWIEKEARGHSFDSPGCSRENTLDEFDFQLSLRLSDGSSTRFYTLYKY